MFTIGFDRTGTVHVHQEQLRGTGGPKRSRNRNQKRIWYWIVGSIILLLVFAVGYVTGLKCGKIQVDGRDISISSNGIIHNRSCIYFREDASHNCQFCGGLKNK